jgi:hypothetical protein
MNAVALAQQAEAQNATTLILAAINTGLISIDDANNLTADDIGEIGILATPEQVRDYVFQVLHETPEQRAARRVQERAALQQVRQAARDEIQARADARVNTMGGKRRRKRTRKTRL